MNIYLKIPSPISWEVIWSTDVKSAWFQSQLEASSVSSCTEELCVCGRLYIYYFKLNIILLMILMKDYTNTHTYIYYFKLNIILLMILMKEWENCCCLSCAALSSLVERPFKIVHLHLRTWYPKAFSQKAILKKKEKKKKVITTFLISFK